MTATDLMDTTAGRESQPPITIGMPIYNGVAHIEEALAALTEQTYQNYRLIISDNASTDGTWDILQAWAARDERIQLHRQQSNIGMVANFSYVLDQAETEYFIWHAYDDWMAPNYLAALVRVITSEPDCALACGAKMWLEPDGVPIRRLPFRQDTATSRRRRVAAMLWCPDSIWYYGLYRTEDARKAQAVAEEFGYVWANDRLTILWFILNDQLRGTDSTTLNKRRTTASAQTYRPNTMAAQVRIVLRYLRFHCRLLHASRLRLGEKLLLLPWLLCHAARTTGLGNYKRLFKYPFRRFVKGPVKRLVKAATGRPAG